MGQDKSRPSLEEHVELRPTASKVFLQLQSLIDCATVGIPKATELGRESRCSRLVLLADPSNGMCLDSPSINCPGMGLCGKEALVQGLGHSLVLIHAAGTEPDCESLRRHGIMYGGNI